MSWVPFPLPANPAKAVNGFVAHSTVATPIPSLMFAPPYSWEELAKHANHDFKESHDSIDGEYRDRLEGIAKTILPNFWRKLGLAGDVIVVLSNGTAILVPRKPFGSPFAGFTNLNPEQGSVSHKIPHLFDNREAGAAAELIRAERHYSAYINAHPEDKKYVDAALVGLNCVEYPYAGTNAADAAVVALWHRPGLTPIGGVPTTEWAALVECACFSKIAIGVISTASLPTGIVPDSLQYMKDFADDGRNNFRNDFLMPMVLGCYTIGSLSPDKQICKQSPPSTVSDIGADMAKVLLTDYSVAVTAPDQ